MSAVRRGFELAPPPAGAWALAEVAVGLIEKHDALPWWAWLRRWLLRGEMEQLIEDAELVGLGVRFRLLFGGRLD